MTERETHTCMHTYMGMHDRERDTHMHGRERDTHMHDRERDTHMHGRERDTHMHAYIHGYA